ncbi:PIN domain-containing protein [Candidatus Gottesmanbacteria bacterium]|nr:PIN domain-containing protein [Candidatus Gottesmanbacteria bacterium]
MAKLLDANTIIRYLTADDKKKANRIEHLFRQTSEKFVLTDVSVAEVVWVLESHYRLPRSEIVAKLRLFLALEALDADKALLSDAFDYYWSRNIDYIDAYLAAYAAHHEISTIISYDRDLDKISGISREEP